MFYILWNNYHWASEQGEEVLILRTRNPAMDTIGDRAMTRYILMDTETLPPHNFQNFFEMWQRVQSGTGQGRGSAILRAP